MKFPLCFCFAESFFFFGKCLILSNALSAFIHMFIYFSLYFNMANNSLISKSLDGSDPNKAWLFFFLRGMPNASEF